jgi:hypothetical protein
MGGLANVSTGIGFQWLNVSGTATLIGPDAGSFQVGSFVLSGIFLLSSSDLVSIID